MNKKELMIVILFLMILFLITILTALNIDWGINTTASGNQSGTSIFVNVSASSTNNISTFIDFDGSLQGWWRFEESSLMNGSVLSDFNNKNNGTVYANDSSGNVRDINSSGYLGKGGNFDGEGDRILLADSKYGLNGSSYATFSAWIKPAPSQGSSGGVIIFINRGTETSTRLTLTLGATNSLTYIAKVRSANEADQQVCTATNPVIANQWNHVVAVYDLPANKIYMYLNGVADGSCSVVFSQTTFADTTSVNTTMGGFVSFTTFNFNGTMDDLILFNRNLSAVEIASLYTNTTSRYLTVNFTNLSQGIHTYKAYSQDSAGNVNNTDLRTLNINSTLNITLSYPARFTTFQRHNSTTGEILIYGTYVGFPSAIEASFNGGSYATINASLSGGTFSGRLNASVGQGNLTVRFSDNPSTNASVSDIGIGDVFVIGGQSNAEGWATYMSTLNSSNLYNATVYMENETWKIANDPTDNERTTGSPWVKVADHIIQNQSVPVSFIATSESATAITCWQKGQACYTNMISMISKATNGTMNVKTMLFYQGETDARTDLGTKGSYSDYKSNLTKMANDFINDTSIATTIIAGQIDKSYFLAQQDSLWNRTTIDNIRRAQRELWDENGNISAGPVTYDIPQSDSQNVHFNTEAEITAFANRWWASVSNVVYGIGDGRGPRINNVTFGSSPGSIILSFNETSVPLLIKNYNGTSSLTAQGFRILDGSAVLNDSNITSTSLINNYQLQINLSANLSLNANISLGSYLDGYNKSIIQDSSAYSLPAEPFYNISVLDVDFPGVSVTYPVDGITYSSSSMNFNLTVTDNIAVSSCWYTLANGAANYTMSNTTVSAFSATNSSIVDGTYTAKFYCNDTSNNMNNSEQVTFIIDTSVAASPNTDTTSGSVPSYSPSQTQLENGYSTSLGTSWTVNFKTNNNNHKLKIDMIDNQNKKATITISSQSQTKTLSIGDEWKVSLENSSYYDIYVKLNSIVNSKANLTIKSIYEKILITNNTDLNSQNTNANNVTNNQQTEKENFWVKNWGYLLFGVIVVIIIALIFIKVRPKKRHKYLVFKRHKK